MTGRHRDTIGYALNLGVIAALAILLGFALLKLADIERNMRINVHGNMLWVISQAHAASLQLDAEVARQVARDVSGLGEAQTARRFDVLASRLTLLFDGPQSRYLEELGFADELAAWSQRFDELERLVGAIQPDAHETAQRVHEMLQPLSALLNRAANQAMVSEWNDLGGRLDEYRHAVWQIIASVIGIMLSGAILSARLLSTLRKARLTELSLRHEKEFSERLIGSSGEGILALDAALRCTLWNRAMERLVAASAGDAIGRTASQISPLLATDIVRDAFRRALAGEYTLVQEQPLRREGLPVPLYLDLACFPLRVDGEVIGVIAFVRDVTARHAAERDLARRGDRLEELVLARTHDLQEAQSQLVAAIDTAPDGFAAFGRDGGLVLANSRLRDLFPDADRLLQTGAPVSDLVATATCFATDDPLHRRDEIFIDGELRRDLHLPDDRWVQMTVKPVPAGGTIMRLADVTPYKRAAIELEKALERERGVSEFYRGFASMVSHQFRTPLAIIASSMQRLVRRGDKVTAEEIAQRAAKVRSGIARLTRLVESTLDAARLDTGQIEVKSASCDLAELVRMICERESEGMPEREFSIMVEPDAPVLAECDPSLAEHTISNLLSNAIKYSPADTPIAIRIGIEGERVHCAVSDRGVGIPADEVPRLFERFFRASTASGVTGTGIGLNLSRSLARLQGGDVTVDTREGEGSTFTLHLPLAQQSLVTEAAE
jgi:PAS domain S-box-containing protein